MMKRFQGPKFAEYEGSERTVDFRVYGRSGALSLDLLWTYIGSRAEFLIVKLVLSS